MAARNCCLKFHEPYYKADFEAFVTTWFDRYFLAIHMQVVHFVSKVIDNLICAWVKMYFWHVNEWFRNIGCKTFNVAPFPNLAPGCTLVLCFYVTICDVSWASFSFLNPSLSYDEVSSCIYFGVSDTNVFILLLAFFVLVSLAQMSFGPLIVYLWR